jgi:hypothetical protein
MLEERGRLDSPFIQRSSERAHRNAIVSQCLQEFELIQPQEYQSDFLHHGLHVALPLRFLGLC